MVRPGRPVGWPARRNTFRRVRSANESINVPPIDTMILPALFLGGIAWLGKSGFVPTVDIVASASITAYLIALEMLRFRGGDRDSMPENSLLRRAFRWLCFGVGLILPWICIM